MSTLNLIITTAGQAAIAQAGSLGPVVISKIAIGSGTWSVAPTPSATALNSQVKQLDPSGSSTPSAGIIHITATDNSTDVYNVYEMGLYTSTGVLFAIAGGTTLFLNKATGSSALFSIDLAITNVPSGSVVIGDAGFTYPPATETTQGVAEIATSAEVAAGTDDTRIVTPLKLAGVTAPINTALLNVVNERGGYKTGSCFTIDTSTLYKTPVEFTIPSDETWVFEFHAHWTYPQIGNTRPDAAFYISPTLEKSGTADVVLFTDGACTTAYGAQARAFVAVILNSTLMGGTSKKLKFTTPQTNANSALNQYSIMLRKFKTADFNNNISIL
jgi:hypothetical protein